MVLWKFLQRFVQFFRSRQDESAVLNDSDPVSVLFHRGQLCQFIIRNGNVRMTVKICLGRIHTCLLYTSGEDFQGAELQPWKEYFTTVAKFLLLIEDTRQFLEQGKQATATLEELQQRNRALYEDILPENYENSFANPAYAVKMLGEEFGVLVSFLYTEMRSLIGFTYEGLSLIHI